MRIHKEINPHRTSRINYMGPWVQGSKITCSWEPTDFRYRKYLTTSGVGPCCHYAEQIKLLLPSYTALCWVNVYPSMSS